MPDDRFAIASDHAGVGLKAILRAALEAAGARGGRSRPERWRPGRLPDYAQALASEIEAGAPTAACSFAGAASA